MVRKYSFLSLLIIAQSHLAFADGGSINSLPTQEQAIVIERFHDGISDHLCSRLLMVATQAEKKLSGLSMLTARTLLQNPAIISRVGSNDKFALQIMVDRKVVPRESLRFYSNESKKIDSAQITNIETVELISKRDLLATGESIDELYKNGSLTGYINQAKPADGPMQEYLLKRKATFRVTSGQVLDENSKIQNKLLPWMLEFPNAPHVNLDRTQYEMIWEFGRAAQNQPGLNQTNLALGAVLALRELQAVGGNLDRAYLFAHAPKKINADLYKRWGGKTYSIPKPDQEDEILAIPLKALIENSKYWETFNSIQMLKEFSGKTTFDYITATRLMDQLADDRISEAEIFNSQLSESFPIALYDYNSVPHSIISEQVKEYLPFFVNQTPSHELIQMLLDQSENAARLYAEKELNLTSFDFKVKETNSSVPEVEILGATQLANTKNGSEKLASALLGSIKIYSEKLKTLKESEIRSKILHTFFSIRGTKLKKTREKLKSFGITFQSISVPIDSVTIETIFIPGSELLGFEKANAKFSDIIDIQTLNKKSRRIYNNPLNF